MASLNRAIPSKIRCISRICGNTLNDHRLMMSTAKLIETEESRKLKNLSRADYSIKERIPFSNAPPTKAPTMIESLDIQIKDRKHHVSFTADEVIKWIRFGLLDPNIATQYCFFLSKFCKSCSEEDQKYFGRFIIKILQLVANRKLPNSVKAKLCSEAAAATPEVCHEVVTKIIDIFGESDSWSPIRYSEILIACYKFSLIEDAEKLLDKYGSIIVTESAVDALLDMMNNHSVHESKDKKDQATNATKESLVNHFVKVMSNLEIKQSAMICRDRDSRLSGLEKCGISITRDANIKYGGKCTNCNNHVPLLEKQIAQTIHTAIKTNCFDQQSFLNKTSTPQEIERFEKFLDNLYKRDRKPLDLVIDGLNIAFNKNYSFKVDETIQSDGVKKIVRDTSNSDALSQRLVNTIIRTEVLNNYRRILLIGRFSMKHWRGLTFFLNKHNVDVFFLDAKSNDDLFTLYAATKYPKTLFMSNDLMRQHIPILFKESDEGKKDMSLWLETHQIMVTTKLQALRPKPYCRIPSVLPEKRIMHLPVFDFDKYNEFVIKNTVHELPGSVFTWLCCKY